MGTKIFLSIFLLYNLAVLPTQTAAQCEDPEHTQSSDIYDYVYADGKTLKVTS